MFSPGLTTQTFLASLPNFKLIALLTIKRSWIFENPVKANKNCLCSNRWMKDWSDVCHILNCTSFTQFYLSCLVTNNEKCCTSVLHFECLPKRRKSKQHFFFIPESNDLQLQQGQEPWNMKQHFCFFPDVLSEVRWGELWAAVPTLL